jgi:hypothetical protein
MTEAEWLKCDNPHDLLKYLAARPRRWTERLGGWLGARPRHGSARKLGLFGVACCRRIWALVVDGRSRQAIEVYERYLDGLAGKGDFREGVAAATAAVSDTTVPRSTVSAWLTAARARAAEAVLEALGTGDPAHEAAALAREAVRAAARGTPAEASRPAPSPAPAVSDSGSWVSPSWSGRLAPQQAQQPQAQADPSETAWLAERHFQADLVRDLFGNPFQPVSMSRSWLTARVVGLAREIYVQRSFGRLAELAGALEEAGCTHAGLLSHCRSTGGEHVRGCWAVDQVLGKE